MRTFAFDLDGTLAPSKSSLDPAMAKALGQLLAKYNVAVISGGAWPQFESQLLAGLESEKQHWQRLHLLPTCGTHYRRWDGQAWQVVYDHPLDQQVRTRLIKGIKATAKEMGLWENQPYGEIIEDRGSQITFSALGQLAPLEKKEAWDRDGSKKLRLRDAIAAQFPQLEVKAGGSTSVDITAKGIDKAYGLERLIEQLGTDRSRVTFIGDRLDPGGNDYAALKAGVACHWVHSWQDCLELLHQYLRD